MATNFYGLSAPPQPIDAAADFAVYPSTTALPALADGSPWKYALITTNLGATHYVAFGNSSASAVTDPWFGITREIAMVVNIAGMTHCAIDGTGGGQIRVCPISSPRGDGNMLRSPPQVLNSTLVSTTSAVNTALPTNAAGNPPKYVMVGFNGTSAIGIGFTMGSGTSIQMFLSRDQGPIILTAAGTHIYNSASAGQTLVISALEY